METGAEAANLFIGSEHAVTRDKDWNGIGAAGPAHGPDRPRLADGFGNLAVAFGFARRNFKHFTPNALLEIRAEQVQWREFCPFFPGEEAIQGRFRKFVPPADPGGHTVLPLSGPGTVSAWKIQTGQAAVRVMREKIAFVCGHTQRYDWRFHGR